MIDWAREFESGILPAIASGHSPFAREWCRSSGEGEVQDPGWVAPPLGAQRTVRSPGIDLAGLDLRP